MTRRLGAATVVLLAVVAEACSTSGPSAAAAGTAAGNGPASTYLLLADCSIHRNEAPPAAGFYVLGRVEAGAFVPTSGVLGTGVLGGEGQPGWVELRDGTFYPDQTARAPSSPYVHGFKDADGVFRPDSQEIH